MSAIKKLFGIVWTLMGVGIIPLVIMQAMKEIAAKPSEENWIFWSIVIVVLMPDNLRDLCSQGGIRYHSIECGNNCRFFFSRESRILHAAFPFFIYSSTMYRTLCL
jgi:hypothetical protein